MYRQQISRKTSPSSKGKNISKKQSPTRTYGTLSSVVQRAQQDPSSLSGDEWRQLDSAIGTRAVREIKSGKQTPWVPKFVGISAQLWGETGQKVPPIQTKLTIGEVGDKYEQEADRVAKEVVEQINRPAPVSPEKDESVQRKERKMVGELSMKPMPAQKEEEAMEEEGELIKMKPIVQRRGVIGGVEASSELESAINRARGGGQPLVTDLQQSMGEAMGADFSVVRVHTDERADRLNRALSSRAFTTGQDLFFKKGEYQPGSREGQGLIAHELTHVVQQRREKDGLERGKHAHVTYPHIHVQAKRGQSGLESIKDSIYEGQGRAVSIAEDIYTHDSKHDGKFDENTVVKIEQTAREMGYLPEKASRLAKNRPYTKEDLRDNTKERTKRDIGKYYEGYQVETFDDDAKFDQAYDSLDKRHKMWFYNVYNPWERTMVMKVNVRNPALAAFYLSDIVDTQKKYVEADLKKDQEEQETLETWRQQGTGRIIRDHVRSETGLKWFKSINQNYGQLDSGKKERFLTETVNGKSSVRIARAEGKEIESINVLPSIYGELEFDVELILVPAAVETESNEICSPCIIL